jgi:hypothetical protein
MLKIANALEQLFAGHLESLLEPGQVRKALVKELRYLEKDGLGRLFVLQLGRVAPVDAKLEPVDKDDKLHPVLVRQPVSHF